MRKLFNLLPRQWKLYASGISNISQAIIIFSLAAIFVPEAVSLSPDFPKIISIVYLLIGISFFFGSGIIMRRGSN